MDIKKLNSGKYRARYRDAVGKLHQRTHPTKREAESWIVESKGDLARGTWVNPRSTRTRFETIAEDWRSTQVHLEETTRGQHASILKQLIDTFGPAPIGGIRELDVKAFLARLLEKGRSPATATKYLQVLSQILESAVRNGYIGRNPCKDVQGPGELPRREAQFLTHEQLVALSAVTPERYRAMVLLAGYRGLRFGETAALRVSKVNLLRSQLEISEALKEVAGRHYFGLPKHGRKRVVNLPAFLVEALQRHLEQFPTVDGLLFVGDNGGLLRRSNFSRRIFSPAVRRAGLDPELTFHGLRHTAVSMLIAEGAQIPEVAAIMGWSRSTAVQMAMRYGHLFTTRDEHLTAALDRAFRAASAEQVDDLVMTWPGAEAVK